MTAAAVAKAEPETSAPNSPPRTAQKSPINAEDLSRPSAPAALVHEEHTVQPSTSAAVSSASSSSASSSTAEVPPVHAEQRAPFDAQPQPPTESPPQLHELKPPPVKPAVQPPLQSAVVAALQSNPLAAPPPAPASGLAYFHPAMSAPSATMANGMPTSIGQPLPPSAVGTGAFHQFGQLFAAQQKASPNFPFPPHPHSAGGHPPGAPPQFPPFGLPPHSAPPHAAAHGPPGGFGNQPNDHDAGSPKRSDSALLNSMCNRSQRCGICKGCTNTACGQCPFCLDSPQFGGPGVKKQSCLERRCHRVLENKLQRDAPSFRARKGCGTCEDCRQPDCNTCLVCFDRKHFKNSYIPGAMCARKRCNHAVVLDNSTRMKKRSNDGAQSGVAYPKPAKRPSPSDFAGMGGGLPLGMSPMGGGANRNGQMNGGMMMPPSVLHSSPALHNRLTGGAPPNENRPGFHPAAMYGVNPADFSAAAAGFPPSPFQMDPNANRVPGFTTAGLGAGAAGAPNGMCIVPLPNGHFMNSPSFFFPQPLQPTQIVGGAGGKDVIKADDHSPTSAHNGSDDPFQPPSYRKEAGSSVVLQAL